MLIASTIHQAKVTTLCTWVNSSMIVVLSMYRLWSRAMGDAQVERRRVVAERLERVGLVALLQDGALHVGPAAYDLGEEVPDAAPDHELEEDVAHKPETRLQDAQVAAALRGPHQAVHAPGLTGDLARPPAAPDGDIGHEAAQDRGTQEPGIEHDFLNAHAAAEREPGSPEGEQHDREAGGSHDAEGVEGNDDRRPILRWYRIKPGHRTIPGVGLEQAE